MEDLSLGPKILQLRKKMKLTQVQLANKVGVSGAAISHFEHGTSRPAPETVIKLSKVLNFDFSASYPKPHASERLNVLRAIGQIGELIRDREWVETFINKPKNVRFSPSGGSNTHDTVRLLMYNQAAFIKFNFNSSPDDIEYEVSVLALPGVDYQFSLVLEVQGNSMAPRYPDGSRYVLFPVDDEHWQYSTGVHAIWLKSKKLLIKRIVANREGVITLKADATGDQNTVDVGDIAALWRFGQAIHLPPEEL